MIDTLQREYPTADTLLIRLTRPGSANALNTQMGHDLYAVFSELLFDPGPVRCVVISGDGEHFCAGGDLKQRDAMSDADWRRQHIIFEQALYTIMDCPIPVIAAVNGSAYGGGCEIALCCDFIYAARGVRFAMPETGLGIIPGGGGTQNLARAVGVRRARELIYAGAPFTAEEAYEWGMVNRICELDALLSTALDIARHIAGRAPIAVRQAKRAIGIGAELDLKSGLAVEIEAYNRTVGTADRREGIAAALAKRRPCFRDE